MKDLPKTEIFLGFIAMLCFIVACLASSAYVEEIKAQELYKRITVAQEKTIQHQKDQIRSLHVQREFKDERIEAMTDIIESLIYQLTEIENDCEKELEFKRK